jgi:hypothetical protein
MKGVVSMRFPDIEAVVMLAMAAGTTKAQSCLRDSLSSHPVQMRDEIRRN